MWSSGQLRVSAHPDALERFTRWRHAGLVQVATTVTGRSGRVAVVTHAGMTSDWAACHLRDGCDAAGAAASINRRHPHRLAWGGWMNGGEPPDAFDDWLHLNWPHLNPGARIDRRSTRPLPPTPLWASTDELWTSWTARQPPWPQVHGRLE